MFFHLGNNKPREVSPAQRPPLRDTERPRGRAPLREVERRALANMRDLGGPRIRAPKGSGKTGSRYDEGKIGAVTTKEYRRTQELYCLLSPESLNEDADVDQRIGLMLAALRGESLVKKRTELMVLDGMVRRKVQDENLRERARTVIDRALVRTLAGD